MARGGACPLAWRAWTRNRYSGPSGPRTAGSWPSRTPAIPAGGQCWCTALRSLSPSAHQPFPQTCAESRAYNGEQQTAIKLTASAESTHNLAARRCRAWSIRLPRRDPTPRLGGSRRHRGPRRSPELRSLPGSAERAPRTSPCPASGLPFSRHPLTDLRNRTGDKFFGPYGKLAGGRVNHLPKGGVTLMRPGESGTSGLIYDRPGGGECPSRKGWSPERGTGLRRPH